MPAAAAEGMSCYARLGLHAGLLRPVLGTVPAVRALAQAAALNGRPATVVVHELNAAEAMAVPGVTVVPAVSLADVAGWLSGGPAPASAPVRRTPGLAHPQPALGEFSSSPGAARAAVIAAAGAHHMKITAPGGTSPGRLAQAACSLLPDLAGDDALDATAAYSVSGALEPGTGLLTRPPLMAPAKAAMPSMFGHAEGGALLPGYTALAHRGMLFLNLTPALMLPSEVLRGLRQPASSGVVRLDSARARADFPAQFMLVAAAPACPCAAPAPDVCTCPRAKQASWRARLSVLPSGHSRVLAALRPSPPGAGDADAHADAREQVAEVRLRAGRRLDGTGWRVNAEVPAVLFRRDFRLGDGGARLLGDGGARLLEDAVATGRRFPPKAMRQAP